MSRILNTVVQQQTYGAQGQNSRNFDQTTRSGKESRSRSVKRNQRVLDNNITSSNRSSTSSSSAASRDHQPQKKTLVYMNRAMKIQRPKSYDGWKMVGRQRDRDGNTEIRGRDCEYQHEGTNSMSSLPRIDTEMQRPISQMLLRDDERI